MIYNNDDILHTIADHAERLSVLAEMQRSEGNHLMAIEIEKVAKSLRKLDDDNDIVITPRNFWF